MPNDAPAAPDRVRGPESDNVRWGQRKRLEFIDFRLTWEGRINRSDLIERFGISVPQASGDLALYQQLAPANMRYDKREKAYLAADAFAPLFEQRPEAYLNQLSGVAQGIIAPEESWASDEALSAGHFAAVPQATRRIAPDVLRAVLRAVRNGLDLQVSYQSMSRTEPRRRWIGPHALGFDRSRWHVRAWCHEHEDYRDFLLARITDLAGERPAAPRPVRDAAWEEEVRVVLVPHPRLSEAQRRAVATDYQMENGRLTVSVRRALLFYFQRQYNLRRDATQHPPEEYQVVVENVDEVWPPGDSQPSLPFDTAGPGA